MKYAWEEADIICGCVVCKFDQVDSEVCGNSAKHTHKIGFGANLPSEKQYVLIALTDGMVSKGYTIKEMVDRLNESKYVPMPHRQLIKTMEYLRDCYSSKY